MVRGVGAVVVFVIVFAVASSAWSVLHAWYAIFRLHHWDPKFLSAEGNFELFLAALPVLTGIGSASCAVGAALRYKTLSSMRASPLFALSFVIATVYEIVLSVLDD